MGAELVSWCWGRWGRVQSEHFSQALCVFKVLAVRIRQLGKAISGQLGHSGSGSQVPHCPSTGTCFWCFGSPQWKLRVFLPLEIQYRRYWYGVAPVGPGSSKLGGEAELTLQSCCTSSCFDAEMRPPDFIGSVPVVCRGVIPSL